MKSTIAQKLYTVRESHLPNLRESGFATSLTTLDAARRVVSDLAGRARDILMADGERERTQRDALLAFSVRIFSAGLLYLTQIILARWMGGSEYGVYVSAWTWVLLLGGMSHLGLNMTSMRLSPIYREKGEFDLLRGLIRGVRLTALGGGTLVMVLGLIGVWLFQNEIHNQFVMPIYLALVCVPIYALVDVQDGIGRGNAWISVALVPPYILRPIVLLLAMYAAHSFGLPMDASTAAGAAIIATWLSGIVQSNALSRRLAETVSDGPARTDFKTWLGISFPLLGMIAADLLLQNTDVLVISRFLAPADVGIYFAAGKTMALIMFVHYAVGSAVAHKFAALHARDDQEGLRRFVKDAVNWTFWPSLAGALVILALGKPLLWLFGPRFEAGYPVMCILVFGFMCRSAMGPVDYLLNMLGEQKLCAAVLGSAAVLNIALNFILVPHFGMIGGAVSTATSIAFAALTNRYVAWKRLGIDIAIWHNLPTR